MNQQIILSGTGGQGILFLTRFFAEAAMEHGLTVLTSEIHGMAMRGGTVISHVKVGAFSSPLVRYGRADVALIMSAENVPAHQGYVKSGGRIFFNTNRNDVPGGLDATAIAARFGSPAGGNVVLLGLAVAQGALFCDEQVARRVLNKISVSGRRDANLRLFSAGFESGVLGRGAK